MSEKIRKAKTRLEKRVAKIINSHDYTPTEYIEDLFQGGCASGFVVELIYYSDTLKFYKKHRTEIGGLLQELCEDTDSRPDQLLRGWDKGDPLASQVKNQNLLAWFGFEETALRLAQKNGIDT